MTNARALSSYFVLPSLGGTLTLLLFLTASTRAIAILLTLALILPISLLFLVARPGHFGAFLLALYSVVAGFLLSLPLGQIFGFTFNAGQVFLALASLSMLGRLTLHLATTSQPARFPQLHLALLAFLVVLTLAALRSPVPRFAYPDVFRVASSAIALLFGIYFIDLSRTTRPFVYATALASAFIGGSAVYDLLLGNHPLATISVGATRGAGLFGRQVITGTISFALLAFAATLYGAFSHSRWQRLLTLLALIAAVTGITATFTRTAILGIFLLGFLLVRNRYILARARDRYRLVLTAGILLAVFLMSLSLVSQQTLNARLADIPGFAQSTYADPNAGSGRLRLWTHTLYLLSQNSIPQWLIGHGLDSIRPAIFRDLGVDVQSHNSYLNILYDVGLLGLCSYAFLIYSLLSALRTTSTHARLAAFWKAYLVAYFLSTVMFNGYAYSAGPTWYTFLLTGAVLGTLHQKHGAPR